MRRLILYKFMHYPSQSLKLLRRFTRYMPLRDVIYLVAKPFVGEKKGATKAELISRAVEHEEMKTAAADLTQLADEALEAEVKRTSVSVS